MSNHRVKVLELTYLPEGRYNVIMADNTKPVAEREAAAVAGKLSRAIQIPSVARQDEERIDAAAYLRLHAQLEEDFPLVHRHLVKEVISEYSLLYTWEGSDGPGYPILLLAHLDVVPADDADVWRHPAFAGIISEGCIWGRGAIDNKGSTIAILEAVESLLREGYMPPRNVYVALGHDEETGGRRGAAATAAILRERGVQLDFVLDEGGVVTDGVVPFAQQPIALVGIAEKGYLSLKLSVDAGAGHSSTPPRTTPVGRLSKAIARLESRPFPLQFTEPTRLFFNRVAPAMPQPKRFIFAHERLFAPLLKRAFSKEPAARAVIQTTSAAVMFSGSEKENVLPHRAEAVINFRLLPGHTRAAVVDRVVQILDDPDVTVTTLPGSSEPSPVASVGDAAYALIEQAIATVHGPDVVVAPFLVPGATDSRHYASLARNVYRFTGFRLNQEELQTYHGPNERVPIVSLVQATKFFRTLLLGLRRP